VKHSRIIALVVALVVVAAACGERKKTSGTTTATAGAGKVTSTTNVPPSATETGISPTTIHIAVLADVQNPILPGLFKGSKDAIQAFGEYVNEHGGIAGRKLVVDFVDTGLDPEKVKTGMQQACAKDFAMVGTTMALFQTVAPMVNCKDKAGAVTGVPDFAALAADPSQQGSPVTYSALPPERDYGVQGHQEFHTRTAQYTYFHDKLGVTHGFYLNSSDSQSAKDGNTPRFYAAQNIVGIKADGGGTQFVSQFASQADYAPFVQTMKTSGSQFAESGATYQGLIKWRSAAAQQGLTSVKAWSCVLTCYDQGMLASASVVDGTYVTIPFLPFFDPAERAAVPALKTYVDAVGSANANGFGIQAWASALLFKKVVEDVVAAKGVNGLTRAAVLADVKTVKDFTADGIIGPTDVADRKPSPCLVTLQIRSGNFARVTPTAVGKFDCAPANLTTVNAQLWPK
jgi:ABC-type branched-subunit amino acid transport system substrate-binding protein